MLQFNDLSFWEKQSIFEEIDFCIIGGGIVGSACALELRKLYPSAKILLLERGYLPTGASTKNAGFACFGSLTEIVDDLSNSNSTDVWETVALRYEGLKRLLERFEPSEIDYKKLGSWDLISESESNKLVDLEKFVPEFNSEIKRITGFEKCFSYDKKIAEICGFKTIHGGFKNVLEGEINTAKLHLATQRLLAINAIYVLTGIDVKNIGLSENGAELETQFGAISTRKVAITTNGFAQQFLPNHDVKPARAQVIVTSELPDFELPGSFHYDSGYYYFRSVGKRVLLGGGRNLNFEGETTTYFANTAQILSELNNLLKNVILPNKNFTIDYSWAGIMGVGSVKKPIIELVHPNMGVGVRMGGMGVAIGSIVGEKLARLL